ncbi:ATP-grasp domain-containing protein [Salirhabdus sp. Marseille-P4669]|uniref:ATP-grasp domain-containing protein n=1 Tax=Salirhabdus sp. Marseille-P4669 TaxID=2042310 RepID=UPI000C7E1A10|nr:ATP-grasp domain-containing protein [Salirhabdus sp. Marseille-P4669]
MKKKILMLGGGYSQIPAIKYARDAGYYVITCDYLPENPGHQFADEYHNISTTDKEKVFDLALKLKIDGIVAYASDPSALTASYVSQNMGLPGASYNSVKTLAEKDLFRKFLVDHDFNSPSFISYSEKMNNLEVAKNLKFPLFIKPVDSSGSKGISKVKNENELREGLKTALSFSKRKRVIIEEYVPTPYNQLHGDGFVRNGELVFLGLCDQHFSNTVPISSTFPSSLPTNLIEKVKSEVNRLIQRVDYKEGAINVEVRITKDNKIYIMEVGPRSGGNYIPQLMEKATGFNEVKAIIETSMGNVIDIQDIRDVKERSYSMQYIIGSQKSGEFIGVEFSDFFKQALQHFYLHKKRGQEIGQYINSSNVIGVAIAKFHSAEEMKKIIDDIETYIDVIVK